MPSTIFRHSIIRVSALFHPNTSQLEQQLRCCLCPLFHLLVLPTPAHRWAFSRCGYCCGSLWLCLLPLPSALFSAGLSTLLQADLSFGLTVLWLIFPCHLHFSSPGAVCLGCPSHFVLANVCLCECGQNLWGVTPTADLQGLGAQEGP